MHVDQVMVQWRVINGAGDRQVKTGLGCVTCWDLGVSPAPKLSEIPILGYFMGLLYIGTVDELTVCFD